jgi:hypothetical protein
VGGEGRGDQVRPASHADVAACPYCNLPPHQYLPVTLLLRAGFNECPASKGLGGYTPFGVVFWGGFIPQKLPKGLGGNHPPNGGSNHPGEDLARVVSPIWEEWDSHLLVIFLHMGFFCIFASEWQLLLQSHQMPAEN